MQTSARVWFHRWVDTNLPTPPKPVPQNHTGLTGVLNNVATRLQTAELPYPVIAVHREVEKETKGWDRLPPMDQQFILKESATNGTSIPTLPPPTLHRLLNTRNATALQDDCALTYAGNNLYLPTSFCQVLLQGHILAILDLYAPTLLSPLLTPQYFAWHANAHKRAMRIQVLLSMGQNFQ